MHARTRRLPLTRAVVCCAGHLPLRLRARRPRPVCPPEREQGEEGVRVNSTAAELGPLHRTIRRSFRSPPPRHERFLSFSFLSPSPSPQVGSFLSGLLAAHQATCLSRPSPSSLGAQTMDWYWPSCPFYLFAKKNNYNFQTFMSVWRSFIFLYCLPSVTANVAQK